MSRLIIVSNRVTPPSAGRERGDLQNQCWSLNELASVHADRGSWTEAIATLE